MTEKSPYIKVGREMYADLKAHRTELMSENAALTARVEEQAGRLVELEGALREIVHRHAQCGAEAANTKSASLVAMGAAIDRLDDAIEAGARALAGEGGGDGR